MQPTWWLKDTFQMNDVLSAAVVNENNSTMRQEYVIGEKSWIGSVPIEGVKDTDTIKNRYPTVKNTAIHFHGSPRTFYACYAIYDETKDTILPCDATTNPEIELRWQPPFGTGIAYATIDKLDNSISLTPINNSTEMGKLKPGDFVMMGELRWPLGDGTEGLSAMVIGPSQAKMNESNYEGVTPTELFPANYWATGNAKNQGTVIFEANGKANQRMKLMLDSSQVKYVSEDGSSYNVSTTLSSDLPKTTMIQDKTYHLHLKDSSMNITGLIEDTSDKNNQVLATDRKIKVAQGNSTAKFAINTSALRSGYTRYLSVLTTDNDNNQVFGRILQLSTSSNVNATIDIQNLLNVSNIGNPKSMSLYIEDISTDGTSYISEPFEITMESFSGFKIDYEALSNEYTYNDNVKAGNIVGNITFSDGTTPVTLSLGSDVTAPAGHENDYKNFVVDATTSTSPSPLKVSTTAAPDINAKTNSLNVKEYYFCIQAQDANGNPNPALVKNVKIVVKKAKPSLDFEQPGQKDIKLEDDLSAETNLMESDFADTLTGTNITYEIEGGIANILNVRANDANLLQYDFSFFPSLNESNLPTTFKLKVKINETDNYAASDIMYRDILVYKELSELRWIPEKTSFFPNDCVADSVVGKLLAVDGVGPFVYDLATSTDPGYDATLASNNASFVVSSTPVEKGRKVEVKTKSALAEGTYKIQFKVTDAKNKTELKAVEIKVQANAQTGFVWKDAVGGIEITETSIDIPFNTTNKKVVAEGGQSTGAIIYALAPQEMQSDDLIGNASDYLEIDPDNGLLTNIKKVGKVKIMATHAGDVTYSDQKIYLDLNITQAKQSILFRNGVVNKVQVGSKVIIGAIGTVTITGGNGVGGITYSSSDTSIATVNTTTGEVTGESEGSFILTASLNKAGTSEYNPNYESKDITKQITVFGDMSASLINKTANLKAENVTTIANAKVGDIQVIGGASNKSYAISTATDTRNRDAKYFKVNPSNGVVSFTQEIKAEDLVGKYDADSELYKLYVQVVVSDELNNTATANCIIDLKGAPLDAEFETGGTGKIKEVYALNKTFSLELASNKGNGIATYMIKEGSNSPIDVISVDIDGIVHVLHANDKVSNPNDVIVQAMIPANNGYDSEIIEAPLEITKASQPDFAFKTPNIKLGHGASITPFFNGNISNGTITMTSGNNALAIISGSDIKAKTTDGIVVVTAINSGNRDYKSATATANVEINSEPAYPLIISVPAATYGDTGLKADIVLNGAMGADQAQVWSSSDPTIADIDANKNITIKKAGTVTISCTQTSIGEPSVTATAVMVIDPKPIIVTVNDASKYVGEAVPTFSAVIPTADLVGSDTLGQPTFSCKDGTALVKPDTKAGTYDINGTYSTTSYPNYAITVKKGKLTVKQDTSLPEWFHLEGATSMNTLDGTKWVNEDVDVVLDFALESAGTYDEISLDNTSWGATQSVTKEGVTTSDVHFRIKDRNVISTPQTTSVKIDKTKPVVKSITGTPAKRNALSELLNTATFGKYFKPKLEVQIKAEDILPKDTTENSGLKTIHYNVYQIKEDSTLSDAIASGEMKSGDTLKLVDEGNYMVCATALDNAGNQSAELCSGIRIQSIGDDSDEDGIPDLNIDTDGDGNPDINITKNKGDKLPWLNIDTDGDGIADMNIDTNKDGVPDLNTGIITAWKPNKEVDLDENGTPDYKTDTTLKGINNIDSDKDGYPDINIDRDLDGTPELNIDTDQDFTKPEIDVDGDGDGIKDVNIDENNDGTPDKNIVVISTWKPDVDVKEDGKIVFDTMKITYTPKDELEDNGIVIKPSNPGQVFLPNYVLKVDDITKNVDEKAKNEIIEITGSKSEIKHVYDVSLSDGDKTIQPDGSIVVRIPVDETIKNPRILLQNKAGNFEEVEATIENGYFVFETDYLGQVSIVGDKEEVIDQSQPTPNPDGDKTPNTGNSDPSNTNPNTSVKGTYTSGTGGALTGDSTNITIAISFLLGSGFIVCKMLNARRKKDTV